MSSRSLPRVGRARGTDQASGDASPHQPEATLVEAIREDEARIGRPHTERERAAFAQAFVRESAKLAAWKVGR